MRSFLIEAVATFVIGWFLWALNMPIRILLFAGVLFLTGEALRQFFISERGRGALTRLKTRIGSAAMAYFVVCVVGAAAAATYWALIDRAVKATEARDKAQKPAPQAVSTLPSPAVDSTPSPTPPGAITPSPAQHAEAKRQEPRPIDGVDVDLKGLPILVRTNQDKAVRLAPFSGAGGGVEGLMTIAPFQEGQPNRPHNLWMVTFNEVTIWNKSKRKVSLQFTLKTSVAGPVDVLELVSNGLGNIPMPDLKVLAAKKRVPIAIEEHGPGRAAARVPWVLQNGMEQWSYLNGPLDIEPMDHKSGTLAFFIQQLDEKDSRIDLFDSTLVLTDRLSDTSRSINAADPINRK